MKLNLKLLSFFLLAIFYKNVSAQYTFELPKVLEPSPQSKAFTRYGDYPMASNTGLVDITIPLYEIKTKELSLPITMSFHASGRMANETNGTLGMRWTLNCGGLVTRDMKGRPDEWDALAPFTVDPNTTPTFETLYSSCVEGYSGGVYANYTRYDTEYDIFNYALPNGKQGHFILKNENGVKVPMLIPYSPLKISVTGDPNYYGYIKSIEITDVDGTKYFFGGNNTLDNFANAYVEGGAQNPHEGMAGSIPTGWYLNKITSANTKEEISFTYFHRQISSFSYSESYHNADKLRSNTAVISNSNDPYWENLSNYLWEIPLDYSIDNMNSLYYTPTIAGIQYNNGSIDFNYTNTNLQYNKSLLNEIVINGSSSRKIKFTSELHPYEKDIYYLKNVSFMGESPAQAQAGESYNFAYYEPNSSYETLASSASAKYKDWWGYYGGYGTIPFETIYVLQPIIGGGNYSNTRDIGDWNSSREGNEWKKTIGMLKTIKYPTGGETEFVYEGNRYDYLGYYNPPYNPSTLEGPGLRIKEVISKPVIGKTIHKLYKYGAYEDGRGYINEYLRPGPQFELNLEGVVMHYWDWGGLNNVYYEQGGHRTRDYLSESYLKFNLAGNPITYDAVAEYYSENQVLTNKIISEYTVRNAFIKTFNITDNEETLQFTRKFADPENAWIKPSLSQKIYYKNLNGNFSIIKSESYEYEDVEKGSAWDMPTYRHGNVVIGYSIYPYDNMSAYQRQQIQYTKEKLYHENTCSVYGYGFRKYNTGETKLIEVITKDYTDQGIVESHKNFTFEPQYLLPRTEEILTSKGETSKNEYFYPFDQLSVPVHSTMFNKHMLNTVVQYNSYKNNQLLRSKKINYFDWGSNILSPASEDDKEGNGSFETRIRYHAYDSQGNILSVSKETGPKVCYVYSYNSQFPIAKIENAEYSAVESLLGGSSAVDNFAAIVNPTQAQITNFVLSLRNNLPSTAQITTYTYKPLVGITSMTDPRGQTTTYEYDSFQRLQNIKDHNQNIVKNYDYHYKP